MYKNKNLITLFIMTTLSVFLLILSIFSLIKEEAIDKTIKINLTKQNEPIKLIDFTINPSEEIIYKVYLDAKNKISYDIEIWFESINESLKDILFIYVKYDTYRTNKLSVYDITKENKLRFNYIKLFKYKYFELIFFIPENIGNDAQNLDFNFKTYINAKG